MCITAYVIGLSHYKATAAIFYEGIPKEQKSKRLVSGEYAGHGPYEQTCAHVIPSLFWSEKSSPKVFKSISESPCILHVKHDT